MTTSRPSQPNLWGETADESTCSAGGFHAPISPSRARVKGSTPSDQGCGGKCCGWCESCDPVGCSLRTFLLSELAGLTTCSVAWKRKATPAGRSWWVLSMSERRTDGTGFGLWLTPKVQYSGRSPEAHQAAKQRAREKHAAGLYKKGCGVPTMDDLQTQAMSWPTPRAEDSEQTGSHRGKPDTLTSAARQWPTPNAMDGDRGAESRQTKATRGSGGVNLREACNWPTPASRDWRDDGNEPAAQARKSPCLPAATVLASGPLGPASSSTSGKPRGSLNPDWVSQLMGYPADWTALPAETVSRLWGMRSSPKSSK